MSLGNLAWVTRYYRSSWHLNVIGYSISTQKWVLAHFYIVSVMLWHIKCSMCLGWSFYSFLGHISASIKLTFSLKVVAKTKSDEEFHFKTPKCAKCFRLLLFFLQGFLPDKKSQLHICSFLWLKHVVLLTQTVKVAKIHLCMVNLFIIHIYLFISLPSEKETHLYYQKIGYLRGHLTNIQFLQYFYKVIIKQWWKL